MDTELSFNDRYIFCYENQHMIVDTLKTKNINLTGFCVQTILQNADTGDIMTAKVDYSIRTSQYNKKRIFIDEKFVSFYLLPQDFEAFTIYDDFPHIDKDLPTKVKILIRLAYLIYILETENKLSDNYFVTLLELKNRSISITRTPVSSFWAF